MSSSNNSMSSSYDGGGTEMACSVSSKGSSSLAAQARRPNRTLPELLVLRQQFGMSNRRLIAKEYHYDSSLLSYKGAWNVTRMQNMILSVGPGTPAATVMTANPQRGFSSSDAASSSAAASSSSSSSSASSSSSSSAPAAVATTTDGSTEDRSTTSLRMLQQEEEEQNPCLRPQQQQVDRGIRHDNNEDNNDAMKPQSRRKIWTRDQDVAEKVHANTNDQHEQEDDQNEDNNHDGNDHDHDHDHNKNERMCRVRRWKSVYSDDVYSDDESNEEDNEDDEDEMMDRAAHFFESAMFDWQGLDGHPDDDEEEEEEEHSANLEDYSDSDEQHVGHPHRRRSQAPVPSMRHGGCINTAAWLDCGWKLSTTTTTTVGGESSQCTSMLTEECPTQIVTSGDDHLVKFWDVRHAMGMTSPLKGGQDTICPFSSPTVQDTQEHIKKTWKDHYKHTRNNNYFSGSVLPLATLHTGHRGNVFHVTPLLGQPGKVATCGADGYLRITDLESGDASIVVSPEYDDDLGGLLPAGLLSLRPGMCFSHHFLNRHTGLLCSERGLRRFDLRLPPREQPTVSIMGGPFRACKACAIWSTASPSSLEQGDSAYVFAGGSSADVTLCDLRMAEGSSSRVVQHYRPVGLATADHVSVSGLDLSRDKQELLVSYESDQIYTFPVFPQVRSAAGPSLDDLGTLGRGTDGENGTKVLAEWAAYGGHLNRFTFLKNAKYAGPKDEYICTGSDSGHAWIYEKATGAVVSFLNADHSTCNGVIPHPSLPVFITYGMDSTAKLWRATIPVDPEVDDSPIGRAKSIRDVDYEPSPVTRKWGDVQQLLRILDKQDTDILPDHIPSTNDIARSSRIGISMLRRSGSGAPKIGNDLHNLPHVLRQNLYACLRSLFDGDDEPVESDIEDLKHRMSLIRLRHQADKLGLLWNPAVPWAFQRRNPPIAQQSKECDDENKDDHLLHPSDLVPDHPSDWIPYDPDMCPSPWNFKDYFNANDYGDFCREYYLNSEHVSASTVNVRQDIPWIKKKHKDTVANQESEKKESIQSEESSLVSNEIDQDNSADEMTSTNKGCSSSDESDDTNIYSVYNLLYETILLLKDGGNLALQAGDFSVAARRYDRAIQYGAVASMSFPVRELEFAKGRRERLKENGGYHLVWGPLLKVLVVTRLNLALLMLKPQFSHPDQAVEQTRLALHELKPFTVSRGKVMKGIKLDSVHRDDEPEETFDAAVALQAKAYFRLGSAEFELGEYQEAVRSFELSIKSLQQANTKPDNLVLRRLSEAKRENRRKNKRHRRKFKLAFGSKEHIRKKSLQEDVSEKS